VDTTGDGATDTDLAAGDDEAEAWSVMAMYDQGPFFASVAYETFEGGIGDSGSTGNDEIDAWKIGLGYTFGNSKVGLVYEDIEHDNNAAWGDSASRDAIWGSFSHKFGANTVHLAYGQADDSDVSGANDDDGADLWSIGLDHNFSKRTKVYAIYAHMDNDDDGNGYGLYAADNFAGTSYGVAGNDDDVDGFSIGIVHQF
ncbi:MAG: porin, partial [Gammaproteobacteria bacterium]|nr:porin [Gammaproteobacteria bacterium]